MLVVTGEEFYLEMFASLAMNVLNQPMVPYRFGSKPWIFNLRSKLNHTHCKCITMISVSPKVLFHRNDIVDG